MRNYLLFILLSVLFVSCGSLETSIPIDAGKVENGSYKNEKLGWEVSIPEDWEVMGNEELNRIQKTGAEAYKDYSGEELNTKKLVHLLYLKKNQTNLLQSNAEPFFDLFGNRWEATHYISKKAIIGTYHHRGMNADTSISKAVSIDGKQFLTYDVTIRDESGSEIMWQSIYNANLFACNFHVVMVFTDKNAKREMDKILFSSKFTRKE